MIRAAPSTTREEFVERTYLALADAVALAVRLPDAGFEQDVDHDSRIDHAVWKQRYDEIQAVLGAWGDYWTTMSVYGDDPADLIEQEPVNLPLADDLADIWRDLQDGLDALDDGVPLDVVVFEWRLLFRAHWGRHASEALRALHAQLT